MSASKIRVGGVPEHFNFPWHLALENRTFANQNLQVEFIEVPGGTGAMTRMLNQGELDAAVLLTEGGVADIANGSSNRLVKVYAESPLIWGIHVSAQSDIQEISQAQGKRYAISRFGSGSHLMAIVDNAERGWPTDDMDFVVIKNLKGARAALKAKEVDVFMWEKYMTKPLVDSGEFRRIGERIVPWPSFCVSVRKEVLDQQSDQVKKILEIVQDTAKQFRNSVDAVDIISNRYQLLKPDTQAWFDHTRWCMDFEPPTEKIDGVVNYLERLEIIQPDADRKLESLWFELGN